MTSPLLKLFTRYATASFFIGVGSLHFTDPQTFVSIMPSYLPWHLELVYLSGFFEIMGGLSLLFMSTRYIGAWGLVALLVAVYPANIHMLVHEIYLEGMPHNKWLLWARMPLQFVFILSVLWVGDIWPKTHISPSDSHLPSDSHIPSDSQS